MPEYYTRSNTQFKPGDRVKLLGRLANPKPSPYNRHHKRRTKWRKRRGSVVRANHTTVTIQWDDLKTIDQWPPKAVELIRRPTKGDPMTDPERRVFTIPCRLHVECELFILATDLDHARRVASTIDLQDYFVFDADSLTTDSADRLRIDDVVTFPIDPSTAEIKPVPSEQYNPNAHPDFLGVPRK